MTLRTFAILLAAYAATTSVHADEAVFVLEPLGDGASLARPVAPSPDRTNSLVIEWPDGLLIVDAQPTVESARALLRAVAGDDPGRVRYLVLSHPHAEAIGGVAAFPATTSILMSETARLRLLDEAWDPAVETRLRGVTGTDAPARRRVSIGLPGGAVLAAAMPVVRLTPFLDAHSPGDLLVELPGLRVAWVGGVLAPSGEAAYAGDADVDAWVSGLNRLARSDFDTFVGLRIGPVDALEIRRQRNGLGWLRASVEALILDRTPVAELAPRVRTAPELGGFYDLDVEQPFLDGLVDRVVEEAVEQRRKRGVILE